MSSLTLNIVEPDKNSINKQKSLMSMGTWNRWAIEVST